MKRAVIVATLFTILLAILAGCYISSAIAEVEAEYNVIRTNIAADATATFGAGQFHIQLTAQAGVQP